MANPTILNFVSIGPGFGVQEMAVPESWIGKSLRDLALPSHYRVSIMAVHDVLRDEIQAVPDPDAPLKESDTILVLGREGDLARLAVAR
jgi:trk system potassium uptake protein TrkA